MRCPNFPWCARISSRNRPSCDQSEGLSQRKELKYSLKCMDANSPHTPPNEAPPKHRRSGLDAPPQCDSTSGSSSCVMRSMYGSASPPGQRAASGRWPHLPSPGGHGK
eukprot:3981586-Pyramimonas_sp.AAC.2